MQIVFKNKYLIYRNWAGIRAGTSRICSNIILTSKQPSKVKFWTSILNFDPPTPSKIYFSSTTPFFHPKFSIPYCRKGSYGPYEPFWFSAKNRRDLVKRYQNEDFDGKLQAKVKVLLKIKMVRMIHTDIFYRMDLQSCGPKSEF